MITIVAFDIGVHHFAHAIIRASECHWEILHLDCHDFEQHKKVSEIQMDQTFWSRFHLYLEGLHSLFDQCDVFLIERQVGFSKMVNYKCIQMSAHVFSHFVLKYPEKKIIEYGAFEKTKTFGKKITKKSERKQWTTIFTKKMLAIQHDETSIGWIESFPKEDDVCDCVVMILSFLKKNNFLFNENESMFFMQETLSSH